MEHFNNKLENAPHGGVFVFLWSFMFGIMVSSFVHFSPLYILISIIFSIIILFVLKIFTVDPHKLIIFTLFGFLAFGLGSMRYSIKDFHEKDPVMEKNIGIVSSVEGIVVTEPENKENDKRFVLKTDRDKILVSSPFVQNIEYGDQVLVVGKLEKPGVIQSETGRTFDYSKFLSKDDIYYTMSFAKVNIEAKNKGNYIKAVLFKVKHLFTNKMDELFAEPESSLLAGLLVSGKQALPKSILQEFKRAGVVHMVVLSGYNITVVALFFKNIFSFFSFKLALFSSLFGIILFTLMTGATSTVVRASLLALVVLLGKSLHRTYSVPRALLSVAFLMLLENPKILVFDPSFQLSFLSILALVYVGPIVEKYLTYVTEKFGLRSIISTTIATQITVLPYLLYSMGSVSIVSLVSNILILVFVPTTMFIGFIATMLGFINYYLALPFTYIAQVLLFYILMVAHTLGNLSFAVIQTNSFPLWLMLLFYLALMGVVVSIYRNNNKNTS